MRSVVAQYHSSSVRDLTGSIDGVGMGGCKASSGRGSVDGANDDCVGGGTGMGSGSGKEFDALALSDAAGRGRGGTIGNVAGRAASAVKLGNWGSSALGVRGARRTCDTSEWSALERRGSEMCSAAVRACKRATDFGLNAKSLKMSRAEYLVSIVWTLSSLACTRMQHSVCARPFRGRRAAGRLRLTAAPGRPRIFAVEPGPQGNQKHTSDLATYVSARASLLSRSACVALLPLRAALHQKTD
jgi:hypothetical protein